MPVPHHLNIRLQICPVSISQNSQGRILLNVGIESSQALNELVKKTLRGLGAESRVTKHALERH
jgi:hypothetical protein